MVLQIELSKPALTRALDLALASLRRSKNTAKNPQFLPIIDAEILEYEAAKLSIKQITK